MCFNLLIRTLLVVLVAMTSQSRGADVDVGCRASKSRLDLSLMQLLLEIHRSCSDGGLWRTIQCENSLKCVCVYVDSGRPIPGMSGPRNEMRCPVRTSDRSNDVCVDPPVQYPCQSKTVKYRFNTDTESCEKVKGRSCFGFESLTECQNSCGGVSRCQQPAERGNQCGGTYGTSGSGIRYRYDGTRQACTAFFYQGCGGNENRFVTKWMCQQKCGSQEPIRMKLKVRNPFELLEVTMPRWVATRYQLNEGQTVDRTRLALVRKHEDTEVVVLNPPAMSDMSRTSVTLGWKDPQVVAICKQPAKTGMCRAYFKRWYHDYESGKCKQFIYGGCQANGNNFANRSECEDTCAGVVQPKSFDSVVQKKREEKEVVKDNYQEYVWTFV